MRFLDAFGEGLYQSKTDADKEIAEQVLNLYGFEVGRLPPSPILAALCLSEYPL